MQILKFVGLMFGALTLTLPAFAPVQAAPPNRAGKATAHAKPNVNRPKPGGGGGGNRSAGGANRPGGGNQGGGYQGGKPKVSNQNAYKAGQASGKKKGGNNTVIVNNGGGGRPGNGYYDNGRYYDNDRYDDNDNDFLEFVGKTAAITAGVSVVSAVIGSTVNQKPSGCQPVNANGQTYQYCNGTYYTAVDQGYQVVAPPQ